MKRYLNSGSMADLIVSIKPKHTIEGFRYVLKIVFVLLLVILSQSSIAQVVSINGSLSVSGNKIVNKNGTPVSFAGNSFFWSNTGWGGEKYYNANVVASLKNDWNAAIVRVAMGVEDGGGYLDNPNGNYANQIGNKARAKAVIDAAIANNMYVIIDWHTHHAEWNTPSAIAFFQEMAQTYGHLPNVMYEVYNEPLSVSWSGVIKPYAIQVIDAIRAIDPDNIIIVGTPSWSADVDQAANDPINRSNIAYTVHFYAGSHGQTNRDKCQYALDRGLAVVITEWGTVNADGNGAVNVNETNAWIDFIKRNNLTSCNWSINDKNEGASALTSGASTTGGWPTNNLTWSGSVVRTFLKSYDYGSIVEEINFVNSPNLTTSKNSYTVQVNYTVAERRDLVLTFVDELNNVVATTTKQVEGSTTTDVILNLTTLLIVGKKYAWKVELRPIGGAATTNIDSQTNASVIILDTPPVAFIESESYNAMSGIINEPCIESGQHVSYLDAGDWLSYASLSIPTAGKYVVYFRVASMNTTGIIALEKDAGLTKLGTFAVPNTGGWQNWTTISKVIDLPQGNYSIGLGIPTGGYNINWMAVSSEPCTQSATITSSATSFCTGSSLVLNANTGSGLTYVWKNGTSIISGATTSTYTASAAGSYSVEVTNASSCKASSLVKVITTTSPINWYQDIDNDGKGNASIILSACTKPVGYVSVAGDACDLDPLKITPGNCGCGNLENSCLDCAGVPNGTASIDVCTICSGGTTGITPKTNLSQCTSTGIADVLDSSIEIYPNPFIDKCRVTLLGKIIHIAIYDLNGSLVEASTINGTGVLGENLSNGIYLIRFEVDGKYFQKKLIKQ
jgi:endoglucanase